MSSLFYTLSLSLPSSVCVYVFVCVFVCICVCICVRVCLWTHPLFPPHRPSFPLNPYSHTDMLFGNQETHSRIALSGEFRASSEGLGVYGWEICLLWVRGFVLFTGCGGCGTFVCETWHESWRELVCSVSWCWYESCLCVRQDTSHELNHFVSVHMVVLTWNILCETWHKSSIRDMTHYIDMTHSYVTWLVNIDVTHYYMTCVIHMRLDMRHSLVRHDVSHDYDIWDIPRARHDSFMFNAVSFHAGMGWLRLVGSFKL